MFLMTLRLHSFVVRLHYVSKKRYNYVSLSFSVPNYSLLRRNYVIYLFDVVTYFMAIELLYILVWWTKTKLNCNVTTINNWRLHMVVMLQFCFVFVHHCEELFVVSQLRYVVTFLMTLELRFILVRWNYVWKLPYKIIMF